MQNLPNFGDRVRVWPMPGRKVQDGPRPVDQWGGGRFMPSKGVEVVWSLYYLEQLRSGDLLMHAPPCEEHDFGEELDDGSMQHGECQGCGREMGAAQEYDVHFAVGSKEAEAVAKTEAAAAKTRAEDAAKAKAARLAKKASAVPSPLAAPTVVSKPSTQAKE
jgi:hypothetical protein